MNCIFDPVYVSKKPLYWVVVFWLLDASCSPPMSSYPSRTLVLTSGEIMRSRSGWNHAQTRGSANTYANRLCSSGKKASVFGATLSLVTCDPFSANTEYACKVVRCSGDMYRLTILPFLLPSATNIDIRITGTMLCCPCCRNLAKTLSSKFPIFYILSLSFVV